jgi:hypothetical protein
MSTSNDKIQSSKGSIADEVKDQTETRKDAIKEDLQKNDSLKEKASNIKDDLTADKDQLKSKQAEAGKFDSNDPHYFDKHEKSNVTDDADDKEEARDRLETHKDSVREDLKEGERKEFPNTVFADNGKSREDAKWDIYKKSSSEERELEMEDKKDSDSSDKKKLGDWLQDTEEHAIIL